MSQFNERQPIPREIQKWIHSMDLSYQITSCQRDLDNGFLIGEILSREDSNINMRQFNTGNSMENKKSNWENIRKICKKKDDQRKPIYAGLFTENVIDKVINKAPNAAFNLLLDLYKILTSKKSDEVYVIRKVDETDKFKRYDLKVPGYMKPTIINIISDKELQRVRDFKTRQELAKGVVIKHKNYLDKEREHFRDFDFKKIKAKNKQFGFKDSFYNNSGLQGIRGNQSRDAFSIIKERKREESLTSRIKEKNNENKQEKKEEKQNLMSVMIRDYQGINLIGTNFFGSNFKTTGIINSALLQKNNINYEGEEIFYEPAIKPTALDYGVEAKFGDIIKKNYIDLDHNIELEFKKYSDDKEMKEKDKNKDYVGFFFNKFSLALIKDSQTNDKNDNEDQEDDYPKLKKIFEVFKTKLIMTDNASPNEEAQYIEEESSEVIKFAEKISKSLLELKPFLELFTIFFSLLYQNNIIIHHIFDPVVRICNRIKEKDPRRCETIFLGNAINVLLKVMSEKPFFRNDILSLIYSLITNDKYSHLKVLELIKSKFVYDELNYYHIISKWMEVTDVDMFDDEVKVIYYRTIKRGLKSSCDLIKCKSIKMVITFMKYIDFPTELKDDIFIHRKSYNWELLSLILIFCTFILQRINEKKKETDNSLKKSSASGNNYEMDEILSKNEDTSININNHIANESKTIINAKMTRDIMDDISEISEKHNYSIESHNIIGGGLQSAKVKSSHYKQNRENEVKKDNSDSENLKEVLKYEDEILKIIEEIFSLNSPNFTIKIGFIYLADIIHYYPKLAERYIKLLIEFKYKKVRDQVLAVNSYGKEEEYTSHLYTEKYLVCGAPLSWNQITVAKQFANYVINTKGLDSLELTHIQIFHSIILNQEFLDEESDEWFTFYNTMKEHLFVAICRKEYSEAGVEISKKFYDFEKIRHKLLTVSKSIKYF